MVHEAIIVAPLCDLRYQELCDQNLRKVTTIKSQVPLYNIQCEPHYGKWHSFFRYGYRLIALR